MFAYCYLEIWHMITAVKSIIPLTTSKTCNCPLVKTSLIWDQLSVMDLGVSKSAKPELMLHLITKPTQSISLNRETLHKVALLS